MSMSMSMTMATASSTATASAAAAASSASSMDDMDMGGGCKISMLWNWTTIDSCFLASSWHVRSEGAFAASCIGVALLVVSLEFLRRVGKEYDAAILRQFQNHLAAQRADLKRQNETERNPLVVEAASGPQFVIFRATPLQQLARAVIHAVTFGVAYIIMLLAMYFNGYIIISIIIGAGIGKFLCDWMVQKVALGGGRMSGTSSGQGVEEPTVCCG